MRRVLITGAAGNLGEKLRRHLTSKRDFELVLLDKGQFADPDILTADLGVYSPSWTKLFRGVDVVVHLAAESSPWADWSSLVHNNVDATINVFECAIEHGVRRVVFASSLHAILGYEETPYVIGSTCQTNPTNFYGATKAFGERLARNYAERRGLSAICLRIGYVQPGQNVPTMMRGTPVAQRRWLSNRDFCGYAERAILVENVGFAVVNATSRILGSTVWDLAEAARVLGYRPQDEFAPRAPRGGLLLTRLNRWLRATLRTLRARTKL